MGETKPIQLEDSANARIKQGALSKSVIATVRLQNKSVPNSGT